MNDVFGTALSGVQSTSLARLFSSSRIGLAQKWIFTMKTIPWNMETTKPMHPKYVALLGISTRVFHMCLEAYEEWGKDPSTTFTSPDVSQEMHRALRLYEDNFPSYCSLLRGPSLILANHLLFLDGVLKSASTRSSATVKDSC